jgi:hypothetical protein
MRIALFVLAALLALPAIALAEPMGMAVASVYVYQPPEVSVSLVQSNGTLVCAWDIADTDVGDTFKADVVWSDNGNEVSTESVDCGELHHCAALERPTPGTNEEWSCSVTVRDSYDAAGYGSAQFSLAPLSFFSGLLRSLLSFFNLA